MIEESVQVTTDPSMFPRLNISSDGANICAKEPLEIARTIKHSLGAVERYIDTFCRVVYCQRKFRNTLKTALVVGVSVLTVNTYLELHTSACKDPAYRERISEIEKRGRTYYKAVDFKKNPGQTERRLK